MKLTDRMVEKERDLDEKIAAMQSEIAELHLQLLQDRTKAADTEFFIESGRFEPIECANFRWVWINLHNRNWWHILKFYSVAWFDSCYIMKAKFFASTGGQTPGKRFQVDKTVQWYGNIFKTRLFPWRWIIQVVWDTDNNKRIDTFVLPTTWVYACAISPSGELLATGGMDNKCTLFRIREGECDNGRESKRSVQCTVLYTVLVHLCADSISFKTFNLLL